MGPPLLAKHDRSSTAEYHKYTCDKGKLYSLSFTLSLCMLPATAGRSTRMLLMLTPLLHVEQDGGIMYTTEGTHVIQNVDGCARMQPRNTTLRMCQTLW